MLAPGGATPVTRMRDADDTAPVKDGSSAGGHAAVPGESPTVIRRITPAEAGLSRSEAL